MMTPLRKILLLLFVLSGLFAAAQQERYTFSYEMGTYEPIDLPIIKKNTHDDWNIVLDGVALNVEFPFFGRVNDVMGIHRNGFLLFGNLANPEALSYCGGLTLKERAPQGKAPVSVMSFTIDFMPDLSRIFKLQLENVGVAGTDDNFINMQVWLYQSGMIEMRYGPANLNNAKWLGNYTGPWIGIDSANNSVLYLLSGSPSAPTLTKDITKNLDGYPPIGMIYRFTPANGGTTGVKEWEAPVFSIYPNPVADRLHINVEGNESTLLRQPLEITDLAGHRVMFKEELHTTDVDVSGLKPGIYFMRIGTTVKKMNKI